MAVSLCPDTFHHPDDDTISGAQAALLKAKGIEEGISSGLDEHWIENWLYNEWGINVDDGEDLTVGQFRMVMEGMEWGD